ncbi:F-box DNA helicase 1 [Elgaria multicarinata webbii]|uniref:F-box DNA helicase 1 n=1 Tax=Elgaria multicarinata webbii TaxID=159646 RepID=UPI002FCD1995
MRRFKQRRLTASDCEALSQSQEGASPLTQPFGQRQGSRNTHQGLYPTRRTKKRQRGAGQSRITDYFRTKTRPSWHPADMAKSEEVQAEDPLESLFAHDDFLGSEDSCSLLEDGGNVASGKWPSFSQSNHSYQGENSSWDQDDQPFLEWLAECTPADGSVNQEVDVKQEVDDVEVDPLLDACFGLLGTVRWDVPQGQIDQLPDEVLWEIFSLVPALDLYRTLSLVCRRWQRIISDPKFIPWKKLYHQYMKGEAQAVSSVNKTLEQYDLNHGRVESMQTLIRRVVAVNSCRLRDTAAILKCLKNHPLFPQAEISIVNRLPDFKSPEPEYVWAVMVAIVLFSGGVSDIQELVACLWRPSSTLSLTDITEVLYCVATLLYAMRENEVYVSNRIHYNIFCCLHLMENYGSAFRTPQLSSSSNKPVMQLTCEQQQILSHAVAPGQVVKIIAFAGTGKTSTLIKYAEKWSGLQFLYLAFNKTIAEQGRRVFPPNVTCRTAHSLAFAEVGKRYSKKLNPGSLTSFCISSVLREREGQSLFVRAKTVAQTLAAFFASGDDSINVEHTPVWCKNNKGEKVLVQDDEKRIIVGEAKRIWSNMKMLNSTGELAYKMTHDGYLKLWQLQTPLLSSYDVIMVDEAQDCTPAIMKIVLSQPCGVVLVGDPHQQIYTFRGAVNALSEVRHSHIFYLTQSFRFGSEIAYVGATILDVCKGVRKKTLVGSNREGDVSGIDVTGQVARLSRNNNTVFDDAVNVTGREPPAKIHLLGGLKAFGLEKIHDIWKLLRPELRLEVRDPFIKRWVKKGFAGIKDYVMKAEDKQLGMKIAIVEKYRDRIPELIERISQCHVHALESADYVLGTVHKAKGLEFDTVQVSDDLLNVPIAQYFYRSFKKYRTDTILEDEWNLLYVAVTRAKRRLVMPICLRHLLTLAGEHYVRPVLMSEACKEAPLLCSVEECFSSLSDELLIVVRRMPFVYSDGTKDPGGVCCPGCMDQRLGPLAWLTFVPTGSYAMEFRDYIFRIPDRP